MNIEIIKGQGNAVAEFFSAPSSTLETDENVSVGLENADRECVPVDFSRKLERERHEAREALMQIEDLFIDGTDIYADRETMGIIAREALKGAK